MQEEPFGEVYRMGVPMGGQVPSGTGRPQPHTGRMSGHTGTVTSGMG